MAAMNARRPFWARWPMRLALALVIGALVGPLAVAPQASWLALVVTGAALVVAPLLVLLIEPPYRSAGVGRVLIGVLLFGALALAAGCAQAALAAPADSGALDALLFICGALTPALATLTVMSATAAPGGRSQPGAAIAVALAAWLGLGLRLLFSALAGGGFSSSGPLGDFGSLVGFVLVGLYCFAALIAIVEGLAMEWLRAAAARR